MVDPQRSVNEHTSTSSSLLLTPLVEEGDPGGHGPIFVNIKQRGGRAGRRAGAQWYATAMI